PLARMEINQNGEKVFVPYTKITDTLYWIDIRNYNHTPQSWEKIASLDGYFTEPLVQHQNLAVLQLLSGNSVFRADWFIYHASDVMSQVDRNKKIKIYNELLYSKVGIPKTLDEFYKIWGLNLKDARSEGNEFAALVTKSKEVARHNRLLFGYRTGTGWLY